MRNKTYIYLKYNYQLAFHNLNLLLCAALIYIDLHLSSSAMAKAPFETLTKLEKIKSKPGLQRRNSTGGAAIFSEPIPIPNYLRASIGSCHDVCKYGIRRSSPATESQPRRNIITKPEVKSSTNLRVKSVPESKNLITNDRAKKVSEPKNLGFPSSRRNPNETLKSTFNARAVRSDVDIKKPKRTSPLPRPPSPSATQPSASKVPVTKTRRSMSLPKKIGPAKPLKRPEVRPKKTEGKSVEEKSIRVVEAKDKSQNEGFVSSSDQKQETGSEANDVPSPRKVEELDPSSPIKAEEINKEEVLEPKIEEEAEEEEEEDSKEKRVLRRAFSEGDFDNKENEKGMRIVVEMGKDKVRALVHAFETLITT